MSVNQRSRVVMSMNPSSVVSETATKSDVESTEGIRSPKDYMFARSDFTKEKEKFSPIQLQRKMTYLQFLMLYSGISCWETLLS